MAHLYNRKKKSTVNGATHKMNGAAMASSTTLLVSQVGPQTREDQLYELFGKCGEVKRVVPCIDNFNSFTGECFVVFVNGGSAKDAQQYLHGVKLDGCELQVKQDKPFMEGRQHIVLAQETRSPSYGGGRNGRAPRDGGGGYRRGRGGGHREWRGRDGGGYRGGRGGGRSSGQFIPDYDLDNNDIRIVPSVFVIGDEEENLWELPVADRMIKKGNYGTIPKDIDLHRKKAESRGEEMVVDAEAEENEGSIPKIDDEMLKIKDDLNTTKHTLDKFNGVDWAKHTAITNRSAKTVRDVRTKCHGEMVDNTWVKLYELLMYRSGEETEEDKGLLPPDAIKRGRLNCFFLNETRGTLISSLNHYIKSNHIDSETGRSNVDIEWFSMYNEQQQNVSRVLANDKRFIDLTLSHWLNQPESAPQGEPPLHGDITVKENIEALWKRFDTMEYKPDFVVADGSVNVWDSPGEQENLISRLKWCEMLTTLGVLTPGGSFVVKYYTAFEYSSIALLYLLRTLFKRIAIIKPYTTKESNSEVFITCYQFNPPTDIDLREYLSDLFDAIMEDQEQGVDNKAPIRVHEDFLPQSLIKTMTSCAKDLAEQQMQAIERNVELFGRMSQEEKSIVFKTRLQTAHEFIKQMKLRQLDNDSDRIVKTQYLSGTPMMTPDGRPVWTSPRPQVTGTKRTFEQVQKTEKAEEKDKEEGGEEGEKEGEKQRHDVSDTSSIDSSDDEDGERSHKRRRR